MATLEKTFVSKDMAVSICFGNFGFLERMKMLYFLILGRTVRFAGTCIQGVSMKDIKEVRE